MACRGNHKYNTRAPLLLPRPGKRILTFEISELKPMANGGRGLLLMDLEPKEELAGAAAYTRSVRITALNGDTLWLVQATNRLSYEIRVNDR